MAKKPETGTYPNRIAEFLQHMKGRVTQDVLARAASITQPTMNALIKGQTKLSPERAQVIAALLACNWWELSENLEKIYDSMQKRGDYKKSILKFPKQRPIEDHQFGPDMVPILGYANASDAAVLLNYDEPIGYSLRHPSQKDVKNAYFLEVYDESMSPRYYPGELAAINGDKNPLPKRDCAIEMNNGEAYIKQFIRMNEKEIVCYQLNPAKEWKRPRSDIKAIHAIGGRTDK